MKQHRKTNRLVSVSKLVVFLFIACVSMLQSSLYADHGIVYKVSFPNATSQIARIEMTVPSKDRTSIDMFMPIWSPGYYRVEDYAGQIQELIARNEAGKSLPLIRSSQNQWRVEANGEPSIVVTYDLRCVGRGVTSNWVGENLLVLNGPATFLCVPEFSNTPMQVHLNLASSWSQSISGLDATADGVANHYVAPNYDVLVDSPIVAGKLSIHEFTVAGSHHKIADAGDFRNWDGDRGAKDLEKIVAQTHVFWGQVPFRQYVFLNVFRNGGGGLEHSNSTLLTSSIQMTTPNVNWLSFVSHEYFHAYNVKRLRPVELSKLDYQHPPSTASLWISEGLTTYFGDLIVARSRLCDTDDFLGLLSSHIASLQNSPGRLKQTLEQASLDVWTSGTSGVGRDPQNLVSYYVKGPVVGFLLDAKIQRATQGAKSLDDVMRLAYQRYSNDKGFTAEEFRKVAEEVSGIDLQEPFRIWLATTEELDYREALDWFGLQFEGGVDRSPHGRLLPRKDASADQKSRLASWLGQNQ